MRSMDRSANRVFISYRRDDAAGYAGRLEEALERRLGHGSVFRDVLDIAPGEDFIQAIRARLSGANAVLVLIGPRWAGADAAGSRRIDDERDFVRMEVAAALDSGAQVVPVLLPGADMPAEASLPAPLQALARRNAMSLGDAHWDADIARLADSIGLRQARSRWPLAAGAAVLAAALVGGWVALHPGVAPLPPPPPPAAGERLLGVWVAPVRYAWGDSYPERFEFKRHAGELTGTASFLAYPRAIEKLRLDGGNLHFETRSTSSMNNETRELTRSYAAELRGQPPDEVLAFRMLSSGGFTSDKPIEFEARRQRSANPTP
jgi:TIR domain